MDNLTILRSDLITGAGYGIRRDCFIDPLPGSNLGFGDQLQHHRGPRTDGLTSMPSGHLGTDNAECNWRELAHRPDKWRESGRVPGKRSLGETDFTPWMTTPGNAVRLPHRSGPALYSG